MAKDDDRWEDEPLVDDPDVEYDPEQDLWVPKQSALHDRDPRKAKLDPTEHLREIRYIWKMTRKGKTQAWIAEAMGRTQPWVSKRLRQGREMYRPPGLAEATLVAIQRAEQEYQDIREMMEEGLIDIKDGFAALDKVEKRKARLEGTEAPKRIMDVTPEAEPAPRPEIVDIIDAARERRSRIEKEWEQGNGSDGAAD